MASPSTVFADRYELIREIARGGMADVYLARDSKLDRPVALKVLSPELSRDPSFVERFRREAQSAAGLNQPNIVGIFDWGQEHGTSFIVMEYIDGQTLRDLIQREGTVAPAQIADIGADIAAALSFAHQNGVVHRDVKPGNVLITTAGQVKVTDFGIARASGSNDGLTRTGAVMGTATYFSPEQAQGLAVDGRSDVYSLGVVLYEMATGQPPFTGDSPVSTAYKHVREEVVPPSQLVPSIAPELERVILTCLAKEPADRYQSADDLRTDLLRFRRGQQVVGNPVTALVTTVPDSTQVAAAVPPTAVAPVATTPIREPEKKSKGPVIAVVILLLALIGVIGWLLISQLGGDDSGGNITVESVVGQNEATARAALEAQGLTVSVVRKPNDEMAKGLVVRQDPGAGTKLNKGENVELTVSDGAGSVKVPDVQGLSFDEAQTALQDKGLNVVRRDEASDDVEADKVTRTNPPAEASVERGSNVEVFVSSGSAPVNVPDVGGMDQVEATQTLNNAGLRVQKQSKASSSVPAGTVIDSNPGAGTSVARDSTVTINVSTGPEQVQVPNVIGQTQSAATSALTGAGLDVRVVQVPSTAPNTGKVITQSPSFGSTVDRGTTVTIDVGTGPGGSTTTST
jgi:beta-lactam-binding protein with PASTA domain/tRNA A-37 threonylcarbamoyl transferase component Bud32